MWYTIPMDDSLLKSDVFFFVATIGFIIIALLLAAGLLYVLSILKTIRAITKTAKEGTETVVEGIKEAKDSIKSGDFSASFFTHLFKKLYKKKKK